VSEGLNLAAYMKSLPVKITTHNIGQTDSIANVIFAAGSVRYATPNWLCRRPGQAHVWRLRHPTPQSARDSRGTRVPPLPRE
jgi:hypothetical protein